jgi:exosome complex component CSL4
MDEKKKIVVPGQEVGIEEEFSSGTGTYMEKGNVLSTLLGTLAEEGRTLSVKRPKRLTQIAVGTMVTGIVDNIAEPVALVIVEGEGDENTRFSQSNAYFILHASQIKRGYVKNVRDEIRIGDIIRAKVVEEKNGEFHISTEDEDCGVLKGFCCACRHELVKKPTGLECSSCGRRENRKIAKGYVSVAVGK